MTLTFVSSFENSSILVTGATNGIGAAIASLYFKLGATVFVNGRSKATVDEFIQKTTSEIKSSGKLVPAVGDVSNAKGCAAVVSAVDEYLDGKHLNVLVNNVGIFASQDFFTVDDEEWDRFFQVNVYVYYTYRRMSGVRLCRIFLKRMLEVNSGNIVFVSSEAAYSIKPFMIHYSMTKTAQVAIARGLAELTKGTNVRVNTVLPGPTLTGGVEKYLESFTKPGQTAEQVQKEYVSKVEPTSLIQRFITPVEVANVVAFLSSDMASAINGATQRVEGGILKQI